MVRCVGAAIAVVAVLHSCEGAKKAVRVKDPGNIFCGSDSCYDVIGVQRNATTLDIRRIYRALSLQVHPDKNLGDGGESKQRFEKIAKAYEVLTNTTKREEFDFILDHPDAYWEKYGSFIVMQYAKESDVRGVLLGLLLLWCALAYAVQLHNHDRTVKLIRHAAENNLGITQGGNATTLAVRKEAKEKLEQRLRERGAKKDKSTAGRVKKTRKEQSEEQQAELNEIIKELAEAVDITGPNRKPTWKDLPVVWMWGVPVRVARWAYYSAKRAAAENMTQGGTLSLADAQYWAARSVGREPWSTCGEAAQKEAIENEVWRDEDKLNEWKAVHVHGAPRSVAKSRKIKLASLPQGDAEVDY